eukprot:TRINITY_DN333_c0_g2_i3.p1 TRINITY_DN333_c0_g2~~TRINITY_DN333_c0_g2_i3.p1  ORF type:complete len:570 (+),score=147.34 TRINITY_DN333_c0_g2_i3:175-1884(+)
MRLLLEVAVALLDQLQLVLKLADILLLASQRVGQRLEVGSVRARLAPQQLAQLVVLLAQRRNGVVVLLRRPLVGTQLRRHLAVLVLVHPQFVGQVVDHARQVSLLVVHFHNLLGRPALQVVERLDLKLERLVLANLHLQLIGVLARVDSQQQCSGRAQVQPGDLLLRTLLLLACCCLLLHAASTWWGALGPFGAVPSKSAGATVPEAAAGLPSAAVVVRVAALRSSGGGGFARGSSGGCGLGGDTQQRLGCRRWIACCRLAYRRQLRRRRHLRRRCCCLARQRCCCLAGGGAFDRRRQRLAGRRAHCPRCLVAASSRCCCFRFRAAAAARWCGIIVGFDLKLLVAVVVTFFVFVFVVIFLIVVVVFVIFVVFVIIVIFVVFVFVVVIILLLVVLVVVIIVGSGSGVRRSGNDELRRLASRRLWHLGSLLLLLLTVVAVALAAAVATQLDAEGRWEEADSAVQAALPPRVWEALDDVDEVAGLDAELVFAAAVVGGQHLAHASSPCCCCCRSQSAPCTRSPCCCCGRFGGGQRGRHRHGYSGYGGCGCRRGFVDQLVVDLSANRAAAVAR